MQEIVGLMERQQITKLARIRTKVGSSLQSVAQRRVSRCIKEGSRCRLYTWMKSYSVLLVDTERKG